MNNKYINKDISWLSFNKRVLEEAANRSLSVFERLRFLAYFSNNLDEFYHFKLYPYLKAKSPLADTIQSIVIQQQEEYIKILSSSLYNDLSNNNINFLDLSSLNNSQTTYIVNYFKSEVLPQIKVYTLNKSVLKTFNLEDNTIYLFIAYKKQDDTKQKYAVVNIPSDTVQRFIFTDNNSVIFLEDIVKYNLKTLFPSHTIEGAYSFKILRNFKINYKSQENIIDAVNKGISKRKEASITALIHDKATPKEYLNEISSRFKVDTNIFIPSSKYIKLSDFLSFREHLYGKEIENKPVEHSEIKDKTSILKLVKEKDILLHYPYHSFDNFTRFLHEAILNKKVKEISITWYRAYRNSIVMNLLITAARNNKKVRVIMELKAKMEEEKNLSFAKQMELEGIDVFYTDIANTVHAKICILKKTNKKGDDSLISYVSTGNFNEKTATIYTDHALISSSKQFCDEVYTLFNEMISGKIQTSFSTILVSPINLKSQFIEKIDREIQFARQGKKACLKFKMNGLDDIDIINKLYEASSLGVDVELLVRGMSCLVPRNNIRLVRLVDHYLEHGRIYYFHNNNSPELFMGSADMMTKKLEKRIELVFPILDDKLKAETIDILNILLSDNQNLSYHYNSDVVDCTPNNIVRAQKDIYSYLK